MYNTLYEGKNLMKILSVNAGSSSLKFTLFDMPAGTELIAGYFEKMKADGFYHGETKE